MSLSFSRLSVCLLFILLFLVLEKILFITSSKNYNEKLTYGNDVTDGFGPESLGTKEVGDSIIDDVVIDVDGVVSNSSVIVVVTVGLPVVVFPADRRLADTFVATNSIPFSRFILLLSKQVCTNSMALPRRKLTMAIIATVTITVTSVMPITYHPITYNRKRKKKFPLENRSSSRFVFVLN